MAQPQRDVKRTALRTSPLFQAMQPQELDAILSFASERRVRRGQMIVQKGDEGSSMMAVLSGRVRISAVNAEGKEITLNVINPGEVFGEIALLDGQPRSADAHAIEDTVLLVVERRHFMPFLASNQTLATRLLAVLCERLRSTSMALEQIALFDLEARLARLILKLAADYGRPSPDRHAHRDEAVAARHFQPGRVVAGEREQAAWATGATVACWHSRAATSSCAAVPIFRPWPSRGRTRWLWATAERAATPAGRCPHARTYFYHGGRAEGHGGHGSWSGRFRRGLHHVAPQAINQASRMEVQNQADTDAAHAEIGVQLRFVHRQDRSDGFDFQDDLASHHNIGF